MSATGLTALVRDRSTNCTLQRQIARMAPAMLSGTFSAIIGSQSMPYRYGKSFTFTS